MKYQYVATNGLTPVDMELLSLRHEGRMFVTDEDILSWFSDSDATEDRPCEGISHAPRDRAYA